MKNIWISLKITVGMSLLLGLIYVLPLRLAATAIAPNGGEADTLMLNGQAVGAANVGQTFTDTRYFWGRPSAVDYDGAGSGGSNKAVSNPEYLAEVEGRIETFLSEHPYLSRAQVPAEMVTASGSGLDPDISPLGAEVQIERVAGARGLDPGVIKHLVDSLTCQPLLGLFGTPKVNVLKLNIALENLQPNVTQSPNQTTLKYR